jgi:hypothetical protein
MKNALTLIATGKAKVAAFLFLCLAAVNTFAQGTEASGADLSSLESTINGTLGGIQGSVIAIGGVLVGIAAVIGAVMLFKSLARRV